MSFNAAATRLAVSSSNRTVHIFDVSTRADGRRHGRKASMMGGGGSRGNVMSGTGGDGHGQEEMPDGRDNDETGTAIGATGSGSGAGGKGAAVGLASGLRTVVGLLPNRVTKRVQDYVDSNRSFASVRLRGTAGRSICALIPGGEGGVWSGRGDAGRGRRGGTGGGIGSGEEQQEDEAEEEILLVVTNEGILYSYIVDTIRGGECRLEQASSLLMDMSGSQELGSEFFTPERHAPPVLAGQG